MGYFVVRVQGLSSPKGKTLNGLVGVVEAFDRFGEEERLPVWIFGVAEPMALLRKNIVAHASTENGYRGGFDLGSGVGRATIREDVWKSVVNVNPGQTIIGSSVIHSADDWPRFKGLLAAIAQALDSLYSNNELAKNVIVQPTDLNLAHAINLLASGERIVENPAWGSDWDNIVETVTKKLSEKPNWLLMAKFAPHRVEPDIFTSERNGAARVNSARAGAYHIYPCNCNHYFDALEVRFSHNGESKHEIWLDYGQVETKGYVENAVCLNAMQRLRPDVLSQVDPQAFWSAMLHIDVFTSALQLSCPDEVDIIQEWADMKEGVQKSHAQVRGIEELMEFQLLPNENGKWAIASENEHELLSLRGAQAALCLSVMTICGQTHSPVMFEIQDMYRGSQIGKDVMAINNAATRPDPAAEITRVVTLLSLGLASDSADVCVTCRNEHFGGRINLCGQCQCVGYCSRICQKRDWKNHKKVCTKIIGDEKIKVRICKSQNSTRKKPGMFMEVSGVGYLTIFWSGQEGGQNCITHERELQTDANFAEQRLMQNATFGTVRGQKVPFEYFNDLNPLWQFVLSCGPLPSLKLSKAVVDEALEMVGGDAGKLCVESAGFTALEWAAKKGNTAAVEWLCKDSRTKGLIAIGSPIGWAAYTGKAEILRILISFGADPAATNDVLFGCQPPLLLAATNGQLETIKILVNECNQDIRMRDSSGRDIIASIKSSSASRELEGHKNCLKWAKKQLAKSRA